MIKIPENIKASQVNPAKDGICVKYEEHCRPVKAQLIGKGRTMATRAFIIGISLKLATKAQTSQQSQFRGLSAFSYIIIILLRLSLWGAEIATEPPTIDHAAIMRSDNGVKEWTSLIVSYIMNIGHLHIAPSVNGVSVLSMDVP